MGNHVNESIVESRLVEIQHAEQTSRLVTKNRVGQIPGWRLFTVLISMTRGGATDVRMTVVNFSCLTDYFKFSRLQGA